MYIKVSPASVLVRAGEDYFLIFWLSSPTQHILTYITKLQQTEEKADKQESINHCEINAVT
jgi:hypothetical protein